MKVRRTIIRDPVMIMFPEEFLDAMMSGGSVLGIIFMYDFRGRASGGSEVKEATEAGGGCEMGPGGPIMMVLLGGFERVA
jgi:hypothetical protein